MQDRSPLGRCPFVRGAVHLAAVLLSSSIATTAAADYQLRATAFSGGAVEATGGSYALRATLGESGVVGLATGGSFALGGGFWHPVNTLSAVDAPIPAATVQWANRLLPGFPNPFRSQATLEFTVAKPSPVRLSVYDVAGRRVATLVDDIRLPGRHRVVWSGYNDSQRRIASGVYFCRLEVGTWTETRRLLRLR